MKRYDTRTDMGNVLIISSKSHPTYWVQKEISEKIKNTKIYFITNEGADDYVKHCKDLGGEYKSLLDIHADAFKTNYTILNITDRERFQNDFSDMLYNALNYIWFDIQSTQGKKTIYLNNFYLFFDKRYKSQKTIELLLTIFQQAKKYECSIVIFNWKSIDFGTSYFDTDLYINYTKKILNQIDSTIITAIDSIEDMKIISDVFHLTEKEEKDISSLNENEGILISDNKYEFISWK